MQGAMSTTGVAATPQDLQPSGVVTIAPNLVYNGTL